MRGMVSIEGDHTCMGWPLYKYLGIFIVLAARITYLHTFEILMSLFFRSKRGKIQLKVYLLFTTAQKKIIILADYDIRFRWSKHKGNERFASHAQSEGLRGDAGLRYLSTISQSSIYYS